MSALEIIGIIILAPIAAASIFVSVAIVVGCIKGILKK